MNLFIRPEDSASDVADGNEVEAGQSDSMMLANDLALSLRENSIKVRGIYPSSRLSLGRGDLPTVQIELGYLSNPEELQQLQNPDYQNQIIQALYTGIHRYAKKSKEKKNEID